MNLPPQESDYTVDGVAPGSVTRPGSVPELADVLRDAQETGDAVVPWGGGTRMHIGNMLERYTVALDTTALSTGTVHEAGDLTVVAPAGVRISELNSLLGKNGQRLPFDVERPSEATLGGSVASNAGGRMRSAFGGIRDWIIGMQVVLPGGTVTKSGGRVVKNVQGYDLHRLHTGAYGTLGVITEVALKLVPVPATTSTVAAWFDSVEMAGEFAMQVFNSAVLPESITMLCGRSARAGLSVVGDAAPGGDSRALVVMEVSGGQGAVTRMEDELTGAAGAFGAAGYDVIDAGAAALVFHKADDEFRSLPISLRTVARPGDAVAMAARVSYGSGVACRVEVGFGEITAATGEADLDSSYNALTGNADVAMATSPVIERCPVELKEHRDVFGETGPSISLMRSIKQRFDPGRILNPGRFMGRI